MKTISKLIVALLLISAFVSAQDTLYVVKSDSSLVKFGIADIKRITFSKPQEFGKFTDSEGNQYHWVTIGNQTWMLENLRSTKFRTGESITNITDNKVWENQLYLDRTPAWCYYNNDQSNDAKYGKLYNWFAVSDQRNIAPFGWHIATTDEWLVLLDYLNANGYNYDGSISTIGNKLAKSMASTTDWLTSTVEGTPGNDMTKNNISQFNGLPAGNRSINGAFYGMGSGANWWTSTDATQTANRPAAYNHGFDNNSSFVQMGARFGTYNTHTFGFAVRCIRNTVISSVPVLTTELYSLTDNVAKILSKITNYGNEPVLRYNNTTFWQSGICWSETPNPTVANHVIRTTDYNNMLQNLVVENGKKYYVRAFATNTIGTGYSNEIIIENTTAVIPPTVKTDSINKLTISGGTVYGKIVNNGGADITAKGFCWSTQANPTVDLTTKTVVSGTTDIFSSMLAELLPNTTYYVRAYATNSAGPGYGEDLIFKTNKEVNITRVDIPAGTFTMGSPESELSRNTNETQHTVTLSAFSMSKYEITNAEYADFLNNKGIGQNGKYAAGAFPTEPLIYESNQLFGFSTIYDWGLNYINNKWVPVAGFENNPVVYVTWFGATEYAAYIGGSLPTEAQWEYACRAGSTTPFNTGSCLTNLQANYSWGWPYGTCTNTETSYPGKTQPIGSYSPNAWGLYDMHGNVYEWCIDLFDNYSTGAQTDPIGTTGFRRVIRGGSWESDASQSRSSSRNSSWPEGTANRVGFRVVFASSTKVPPKLTTSIISSVTATTAIASGNITSDGGAPITDRGVCWSTSANPTIANNKISQGTGIGTFSGTITGLTPATLYYYKAYATNSVGTSYGEVYSCKPSFYTKHVNAGSVTDIDNNTYSTVTIGTQTWMVENLKTTRYRNGDAIENVTDSVAWCAKSTGAWCNYRNDANNGANYGKLYNWYAAVDTRNIAPVGWHVASDTEWETLINNLGGDLVAGEKLKEGGLDHWLMECNSTNESGFTALPGGWRLKTFNGAFNYIGNTGIYWTNKDAGTGGSEAFSFGFDYGASSTMKSSFNKKDGMSIRCIKD